MAGRRAADRANREFILRRRVRLRDELAAAAVDGKLPYQDGAQLDEFVRDGETELDLSDLELLDEA